MEPGGSRDIAASPVPTHDLAGIGRSLRRRLTMIAIALAAALGAAALVVAVGWAANRPSDGPPVPGSPPVPESPPPVGAEDWTAAGQTLWYAGFQLEILRPPSYTYIGGADDGASSHLWLNVRFTNLGPDIRAWSAPLAVHASDGQTYPVTSAVYAQLSPGESADGELTFALGNSARFVGGVLVAGAADRSQASVPLNPNTGDTFTREPVQLRVTGELSLELAEIRVTSRELRADVPEEYRQVEAGRLALTLHFDLTSRAGDAAVLSRNDFALVLPDGDEVAPDGASFVSENVVGLPSGVDYRGYWIRFLVDDPPEGEYALTFRSDDSSTGLAGEGLQEASLTFTVW